MEGKVLSTCRVAWQEAPAQPQDQTKTDQGVRRFSKYPVSKFRDVRGGLDGASEQKRAGRGFLLVGERGSRERKWAMEWHRLEQRRRMIEGDIQTTCERKAEYATVAVRRFWVNLCNDMNIGDKDRIEEKRRLVHSISAAKRGVEKFAEHMRMLHAEAGSREETIQKVRDAMDAVEDQLLTFKKHARISYEKMMLEEDMLSESISKALPRAEALARAASVNPAPNPTRNKKSYSSPLGSEKQPMKSKKESKNSPPGLRDIKEREKDDDDVQKRLSEIDDEIQKKGGECGNWTIEEHQIYLRLRRKYPGDVNTVLRQTANAVPFKDLYSVSVHHAWVLRHEELIAEKKDIVEKWKRAKAEAELKAAQKSRLTAKRREEAKKRKMAEKIQAQKAKAQAVKSWRENKRKEEIRKVEEKKRKERERKARTAQAFLESRARKKMELVQKKKAKELEEAMKLNEENRRKRDILEAERVKRYQRALRVKMRNYRDAEKREAKARARQSAAAAEMRRKQVMVETSRPHMNVQSKFHSKTRAQKEREKARSIRFDPSMKSYMTAGNVRPGYLGVGRATPSWMK